MKLNKKPSSSKNLYERNDRDLVKSNKPDCDSIDVTNKDYDNAINPQNHNLQSNNRRFKFVNIFCFILVIVLVILVIIFYNMSKNKLQSEVTFNETISGFETAMFSCDKTLSAYEKNQIVYEKTINSLINIVTQQPNSLIESSHESESIVSPALSETTSQQSVPTSTDTPTPSITVTSVPTPISYFEEEFNNNDNFWELPTTLNNEVLELNPIVTGGQYKITINNINYIDSSFRVELPFDEKKENFCFSFDGSIKTNNPKNTSLGLFYRLDYYNFYLIQFYKYKSIVSFGKVIINENTNEKGIYKTIYNKNFDKSIKLNEKVNNYRICVNDNIHEIYINDYIISEINDSNISNEGIFTFVLYVHKGTDAEFLLDNIIISEYY